MYIIIINLFFTFLFSFIYSFGVWHFGRWVEGEGGGMGDSGGGGMHLFQISSADRKLFFNAQ